MADVRKGSFCKSIAGHDKDCCYIIVENNGMLKVCDGKYRKLTNPKVKNIKHLVNIYTQMRLCQEAEFL